jgi:hypothetical protein
MGMLSARRRYGDNAKSIQSFLEQCAIELAVVHCNSSAFPLETTLALLRLGLSHNPTMLMVLAIAGALRVPLRELR